MPAIPPRAAEHSSAPRSLNRPSPTARAGEAMQVTDMGILVNHAYSLIEVAEIGEPHQEKLRLVQLRNPWGLKEWEGPWSDGSREWETAMGRKAIAKLNVTFDGADGSFWMAWEDFQAHFNKIYVCRHLRDGQPARAAPRRVASGRLVVPLRD